MGNKGHSERGFGGRINHYDEHGKKTGYSDPGVLGVYTNYDAKGNKVGRSDPSVWGGYNHYDNKGNKTGRSDPNGLGGYSQYDNNGKETGNSYQSYPGHYDNNEGCYIATCVYGSYDCPQVWTLRRLRDDILGASFFGRCFIRLYYRISPHLVSALGESKSFRRFWKTHLDKIVKRLNSNGVENTPYTDKNWRKNHG